MANVTLSDNPYEVLADGPDLPAAPAIEVDQTGTLLIVQSPAQLPDRCVFTNEPTGLDDVVNYQLEWYGKKSFRLALTKRCKIQYSSLSTTRPGSWQKLILLGPAAWLLMDIFGMTAGLSTLELLACLLFAFILVAVTSYLSRKHPRLEIVHFENGRFWLKGCAPEFLNQLGAELRDAETTDDQAASPTETQPHNE